MESEVLRLLATQGPFAVLFVALLFWVLKQNAKREESYQSTISKLADKFDLLEDVKRDVHDIKSGLQRG